MFIIQFFRYLNYMLMTVFRPFKIVGSWVKRVKIPPWVKYFLEFILVAAVVITLIILNVYFDLKRHIGGPVALRPVWLGLIGALIYLAIRLFIFILQQLPTAEAEFPDIDEAMEEGLAALSDARINIRDVPLYLIVGMLSEQEEAFLGSSQVSTEVSVSNRRLPIHWYGNDKGIFVSLPGVSALTQQVQLAKGGGGRDEPESDDPHEFMPTARPASEFATLAGPAMGAGGDYRGGGGQFATIGGPIGGGYNPQAAPAAVAAPPSGGPRRLSLDDKELAEKRIEYFVKRLKDVRYPVCPVNSVLLVLPFDWTGSPGLSMMADTIKVDMHTLQQMLGVKCLCVTMFSGIEAYPDFGEYIKRLDKSQVDRRCGCSFPPLTNPQPTDVDNSHTWIVQYFERQIFELYQRKLGDPGNGKLFRLLERLRRMRANYVRLLNNAFPQEVKEPFYLGGIYFASLASVGGVNLPFLEGVIARLIRDHDEVIGWTDPSLEEDASYKRLARIGIIIAVIITIISALLFLSIVLGLRW